MNLYTALHEADRAIVEAARARVRWIQSVLRRERNSGAIRKLRLDERRAMIHCAMTEEVFGQPHAFERPKPKWESMQTAEGPKLAIVRERVTA